MSRRGRAHERLADQKDMHAELFDPADLIETIDAALAHYGRAGGHERRQALGRRQVDREGFKIAVIDADQLRASGDGAANSFSVCTSTNASNDNAAACSQNSRSKAGSSRAAINSTASAP